MIAHAQKSNFVFRRNGRVHLNRRGRQFSRLLATEVYTSAVVMLDKPCSEVVWRVLATHSIRQFPPSLPLPCFTVCHHISTGLYSSDGSVIAPQSRRGRWGKIKSLPFLGIEPVLPDRPYLTYSLHITNLTVGAQLREVFGVTDYKQGRSANCKFHEPIEWDNKVCRKCVTNDNVHTGWQNMAWKVWSPMSTTGSNSCSVKKSCVLPLKCSDALHTTITIKKDYFSPAFLTSLSLTFRPLMSTIVDVPHR